MVDTAKFLLKCFRKSGTMWQVRNRGNENGTCTEVIKHISTKVIRIIWLDVGISKQVWDSLTKIWQCAVGKSLKNKENLKSFFIWELLATIFFQECLHINMRFKRSMLQWELYLHLVNDTQSITVRTREGTAYCVLQCWQSSEPSPGKFFPD